MSSNNGNGKVSDYSENYGDGWIKIYRSLKNKSWFKKAEHLQLWIYLLIEVNHKGKEFLFAGEPIKLLPGQTLTGRKKIALETGISESKVERLLTYFEKKECQIEQQKSNKNRIISIVNWVQYQNIEQQVNNNRTTSEQQVNTNKNEKKEKNEKNKNLFVFFEKLWKDYPRKDGKKEAERHFNNSVQTDDDCYHIEKALQNYKTHILNKKTEYQFIKMGSTWFNNWRDWIEVDADVFTPVGLTKEEQDNLNFNVDVLKKAGKTPEYINNYIRMQTS